MRRCVPVVLWMGVILTACGGGGGDGGGVDSAISGWYDVDLSTSPPTYKTVYTAGVEVSGDTLWYAGRPHVREGSEWVFHHPAWYAPDRTEYHLWSVDADRIEGENRFFSAGSQTASHALRLQRAVAPAGSLTITGSVFGEDVSGEDVPAHGRDAGAGGGYALMVESFRPRSVALAYFEFNQAPPLTAGTYVLGSSSLAFASVQSALELEFATAGTLILTDWSASRAAGSFSLRLATGSRVAGLFDVPITLHE